MITRTMFRDDIHTKFLGEKATFWVFLGFEIIVPYGKKINSTMVRKLGPNCIVVGGDDKSQQLRECLNHVWLFGEKSYEEMSRERMGK